MEETKTDIVLLFGICQILLQKTDNSLKNGKYYTMATFC